MKDENLGDWAMHGLQRAGLAGIVNIGVRRFARHLVAGCPGCGPARSWSRSALHQRLIGDGRAFVRAASKRVDVLGG